MADKSFKYLFKKCKIRVFLDSILYQFLTLKKKNTGKNPSLIPLRYREEG